MLRNLLTGLPVMAICLVLQANFVTFCLRGYLRFKKHWGEDPTHLQDSLLLMMVMLLMLLSNFVQMAIWAFLFMLIGEFDQIATALYFSAVNFATLGYGDIVMSERWRLLGPLEAANGILMFGVSTAVMTAAVMDIIKYDAARFRGDGER
jgi:Ion channel